jgi:hypothetical protein
MPPNFHNLAKHTLHQDTGVHAAATQLCGCHKRTMHAPRLNRLMHTPPMAVGAAGASQRHHHEKSSILLHDGTMLAWLRTKMTARPTPQTVVRAEKLGWKAAPRR